MRIYVAQINPTVGDFEGNTRKILRCIELARAQKADVVLFSELCLCGYPPEDLLLHPTFVHTQEYYLEQIVQASAQLMVVVGLVRENSSLEEKPLFNSAAIIQDKQLIGFEDKRLLPTYDVFDERRYFEPGTATPIWEYKGKKIAILICEDMWQYAGQVGYTHYMRDPILDLIETRPDVVLNLSASPYHYQKPDIRAKVCCKCAAALQCPLILSCQVGGNDQLIFDGYSVHADAQGNIVQVAKGFEEDAMLVDLNAPAKPCHFVYDHLNDLYQALVLGVRDYFHKQGLKKGCIGLSGGIDSALVACIAVEALGKENVLAISMPSRFSSPGSITDAEKLAYTLQIPLKHIPIEGPFTAFLDLLEPHFHGKPWDIAEENMQARIRGMILMAISNKLDYIVLSTGNKSELSLGYCTLYGDMCGGLAVIADVLKEQVYTLAEFINRNGQIIPQSIIDKVPSAELRPDQKDSDTLPEYPLLDKILKSYIEEFLSPQEIADQHNVPLDLVQDIIHRVHSAEYKRRQAAPCIRISPKAFGVGRRYPIVQKWA